MEMKQQVRVGQRWRRNNKPAGTAMRDGDLVTITAIDGDTIRFDEDRRPGANSWELRYFLNAMELISDTPVDGAEGVKQQPVSVPWRVGQRRRGVILGAGKYGGKPQDFIVLAGDSYVRTDDGEEWAFGQSWPNELIAEAPEPVSQTAMEMKIRDEIMRERLLQGAWKVQPPPATEGAYRGSELTVMVMDEMTNVSDEELKALGAPPTNPLPQRPEPAPGQVWRVSRSWHYWTKAHAEPFTLTAPSGMATGAFECGDGQRYWPAHSFTDGTLEYVSGPVVDQTRPKAPEPVMCVACGAACSKEDLAQSAPGRPFCSYRCYRADCDKKVAAPSPGAGAGQGSTNPRYETAGDWFKVKDVKPLPFALPATCGLTTRSGIPCDLLPHQHKGRACAVLPKTKLEEGLMKRREMSEADIEREARWPR